MYALPIFPRLCPINSSKARWSTLHSLQRLSNVAGRKQAAQSGVDRVQTYTKAVFNGDAFRKFLFTFFFGIQKGKRRKIA